MADTKLPPGMPTAREHAHVRTMRCKPDLWPSHCFTCDFGTESTEARDDRWAAHVAELEAKLAEGYRAVFALEELLSCHKLGAPPSDAVWKRLDAAEPFRAAAREHSRRKTP